MAKRKRKDKLVEITFDKNGRPWPIVRFNMPNGEFVEAAFQLAVWHTPPRKIRARTQSSLNMAPKTVVRAHAVQSQEASSQSQDVEGEKQ